MPRVDSRVVHVLMMTCVSGCADAIGFLGLGQVLVAAMTGNTVFLGLAIAHTSGLQPLGYVVALCGFMIGAATGAFALRGRREQTGVNQTITKTLGIQWLALVAFGILVIVASMLDPGSAGIGVIGVGATQFSAVSNVGVKLILVLLLTVGMGVQGAVARRVGVNGVPTTVITSLTTGLMESLVWNACSAGKNKRQVRRTETAANRILVHDDEAMAHATRHTSPRLIAVWVTDIIIYGLGAAVCGALELHWHLYAICLPVALVTALIIYSVVTQAVDTRTQVDSTELGTGA